MKGRIVMMTRTCFTVSKSSTKESGCVAAKSKKVEDHRCHRVCFLLVVRIVRLEKRKLKTILGFGNIKIWTKLVLFFNSLIVVTDKLTLNNVDVFYNFEYVDEVELYLEQVDEVDGEDGSHPVVGEPLTGLHPNDEEDSPAKRTKSTKAILGKPLKNKFFFGT